MVRSYRSVVVDPSSRFKQGSVDEAKKTIDDCRTAGPVPLVIRGRQRAHSGRLAPNRIEKKQRASDGGYEARMLFSAARGIPTSDERTKPLQRTNSK